MNWERMKVIRHQIWHVVRSVIILLMFKKQIGTIGQVLLCESVTRQSSSKTRGKASELLLLLH